MDIAGTAKFPYPKKEVMTVGVRERILTIRLMEKVKENPAAAEKLGIVVINKMRNLKNACSSGKGR